LKAKWCYYNCGTLKELDDADFEEVQKTVAICDLIRHKEKQEQYEFWAKLFGGKK
jgi:hypothetical protein